MTTFWCYLQFTEGKTEAQRDKVTHPQLTSNGTRTGTQVCLIMMKT